MNRKNSVEACANSKVCVKKSGKCKFTACYFQDKPYVPSHIIYSQAKQMLEKAGFSEHDILGIKEFTRFMIKNPDLIKPITNSFRYELWSQKDTFVSSSTSDTSSEDTKETTAESKLYSKASILDLNRHVSSKFKQEKEMKSILSVNLYNSGNVFTQVEDVFASHLPLIKKGYLLKRRSECGDFIKR